jgi:hypothetical protein
MYAQLFEPDGTKNDIVTVDYAVEYCRSHPGWVWELCDAPDM